jgi:hypothetical protein
MRTRTITRDDILYGFAVEWDYTPAMLTEWKQRYPLWGAELEEFALAAIRDKYQEDEI